MDNIMDSIFEAYQSTINEVAANVVITKGPEDQPRTRKGTYEGKWVAPSGADDKDVTKAIKALVPNAKNIAFFDSGTGMKTSKIDKFFNNSGTWVAK